MKVLYKNKTYIVHWPKKFDDIIFKAAQKYRQPNGYVLWKKAEESGALEGLPRYLTLGDISHRYSFLKFSSTEAYQEKIKETNKKNKARGIVSKHDKNKMKLFRNTLPNEVKKKHGGSSKTIWTEKQKKILMQLTKIYRKTKLTVDWAKLITDERVNELPYQDRFKLMKYYGVKLKRKMTDKYIDDKRKDALRYKHDNYEAYLKAQERRRNAIKNSVNEFLISQLPLR